MTASKEDDGHSFTELLFEAARDAGVERPVFELRAFDFVPDQGFRNGGTNSGYFDSPTKLADAAHRLDQRHARGVFVTLNPCDPALLARANNRVQPRAKATTTDRDIKLRTWLLIDIDAERPAGISATEEECNAAAGLAKKVSGMLSLVEGWPEPVLAASGNGGHLLYRVDLPNDDDARELVREVLEALDRSFSTEAAKVDTAVHNAARISKVYGTTARKGDDIPDRPHRRAQLLHVPASLEAVDRLQLEAFVERERRKGGGTSREAERQIPDEDDFALASGFLDDFIDRHGLVVASRRRGSRGQEVFVLETCPFNSEHSRDGGGGGSAAISRESDGTLGFKCHHDSCTGNNWRALRQLLEPSASHEANGAAGEIVDLGEQLTAQAEWRGTKVVVTARRNGAVVHVDRHDPASARARGSLIKSLAMELGLDPDDEACRELGQVLVEMAASGPPPATPDACAPSIVEPDPEPWPREVNGAQLLDDLTVEIKRYLVLPEHAAETIALWAVHSYSYSSFLYTPRLLLTSPDKRCGKSRLLSVLRALLSRPLGVEGVTAAAMFRVIDAHHPTLLLDEADTYLTGRDVSEDLRGVVNAGHSQDGRVLRCIGDDHEPKAFGVFAPVVLAMIGRPPGTVEDRSIVITMRRRKSREPIERLRPGTSLRDKLRPLRQRCVRWLSDVGQDLASATPELPDCLDDRAADNWFPLFAIAFAAGGEWPQRAALAAEATAAVRAEGEGVSEGVLLLGDLRDLFEAQGADRLPTIQIVDQLSEMEERPWPEYGRTGRALTARQVSKLLQPFGVRPTNLRVNGRTLKGYRATDFQEAWSRYTPREDPLSATPGTQVLASQGRSGVADQERGSATCASIADEERESQGHDDAALRSKVLELLDGGELECREILDGIQESDSGREFNSPVTPERIEDLLDAMEEDGAIQCVRRKRKHSHSPRDLWELPDAPEKRPS